MLNDEKQFEICIDWLTALVYNVAVMKYEQDSYNRR